MLSFRRDLIINITGSVVNTFAFMWALRACGDQLAPAALGLYLLTRRIAETGSNLVQAGAPPTLRRYAAMESSPTRQLAYLRSALIIAGVTAFAALLLGWGGPASVAGWLFGQGTLLPPNALLLTTGFTVSLVFHNLAVSLLSAQGRFLALSAVTFINTVALLVLALHLNPDRNAITALLGWHAVGTILVAGIVLGSGLLRLARLADPQAPRTAFEPYASYGGPRVLSPFFDAMLVAAGPWLLRNELESAAHLAMALMLLRVGQALVAPAATVIGTAVARAHGAGDSAGTAATLRLTTGVLTALSLCALSVLWPWLDTLVELWLGKTSLAVGVASSGRGLLLAIVPFTVFHGLKEPIEMLSTKPLNLFATALALLVLAGSVFALTNGLGLVQAVISGYLAAYAALATCAAYFLRRQLRSPGYYGIGRLLLASVMVAALNQAAAQVTHGLPLFSRLAMASTVVLISLALAVAFLTTWRPSGLVGECRAALGFPVRAS